MNFPQRLAVPFLLICATRCFVADAQTAIPADLFLLRLTLTDLSGKPLSGADVLLNDTVLGLTDDTGVYCLARKPLSPGPYTLSVSRQGFQKASQSVTLPSEDAPALDLSLKLRPVLATFRAHGVRETKAITRGSAKPNYDVVQIFYVTDRLDTRSSDPVVRYSNERSRPASISRGVANVSIPWTHLEGDLESPAWLHFEYRPDPNKHIILRDLEPLETDPFYQKLNAKIRDSESQEAVVFIHGYNTSFEASARLTAQLARDLSFDGAPILYSWPSHNKLLSYTKDEDTVQWTAFHLRDFLEELAQRTKTTKIHIVAHSMGNRALASALQVIAAKRQHREQPLFQEVILAAPDIGADTFELFAREILPVAHRITLYASGNDDALLLSHFIHGGSRAGQKGKFLLIAPGINTIDASSARTDFLGHGYITTSSTIITDIHQILATGAPPERRRLIPAMLENLMYWIMPAPARALASKPQAL